MAVIDCLCSTLDDTVAIDLRDKDDNLDQTERLARRLTHNERLTRRRDHCERLAGRLAGRLGQSGWLDQNGRLAERLDQVGRLDQTEKLDQTRRLTGRLDQTEIGPDYEAGWEAGPVWEEADWRRD